jgi:hypothetical protein
MGEFTLEFYKKKNNIHLFKKGELWVNLLGAFTGGLYFPGAFADSYSPI